MDTNKSQHLVESRYEIGPKSHSIVYTLITIVKILCGNMRPLGIEILVTLSKILDNAGVVSDTHLNHLLWDYYIEVKSMLIPGDPTIIDLPERAYRM